MSILGAIIVPHPPIILPEVGRGRESEIQNTIDAYRIVAQRVAEQRPDALVVISPHTVTYADYFHISPGKRASGNMSAFGAPQVRFEAEYDDVLRSEIIRLAKAEGLRAGSLGERGAELDHGVSVPLYFLREAGVSCPIVRMGLSGFSPLEHYQLGKCISHAADILNRRLILVASGDLSHKLSEEGPYGFAPEGPVFDKQITSAMAAGDFLSILTFENCLSERAAECGLRSFQIMAGALDGLAVRPELLSYEGPFGVGYAVAVFSVTGFDDSRKFAESYKSVEQKRMEAIKKTEDPWVKLARLSLENYIRTRKRLTDLPEGLPEELTDRAAGVFVSLRVCGQLRGCIGTISPVMPNVAMEIINNAISAGTCDPRFPPVKEDELDSIEYNVDVLGDAEPISGPEKLDVKRYGVIVSCRGRRGLLLPDLDGVDTVEKQLNIAREKGNIGPKEPYTLERFEVVRHK